ncbi:MULTISPECIES: GTP-binding protein [Methylobacterium]|uniref:CobW family GTP-binding protein n=2 Tax=Methylobacteriaceae TaxID=119045 RepID=UPI0008F1FED2|nr:GTP-binding protein [Methylobacterium sp. yr596]MBK3399777.1 GTP-binding protein [Methylobacterium ajmalii]MBK3408963.1 GTP-binding protein [Methylobacterium ajmalii]MBZ6412626.1 GTP-binding protein [Methylobacterium sp.]SFF02048.1 GTPase, G3E family [Methylobacterium sp. yr596]
MSDVLDFVVLTGFLGSGKTTLLRDCLARPEAADTAIIVNEAGEIGLDGLILRESGGDVPMTMLANGCVCCQMTSDLARTVEALLAAERPEASGPLRRIVLETSGLSKPGPVLRQLAGLAGFPMRVSVLATYDALRGPDSAAFAEAAAQWAAAHRIVVTKLDAAPPGRVTQARAAVAGLNPLAAIVADPDRSAAVAAAFAPLPGAGLDPALLRAEPAGTHPRVAVWLARPSAPLPYDDLAAWLDNLAGHLGERLLRLKGLVPALESDRPLLVESVGTLFSRPRPFGRPGEDVPAFLVVIARDLEAGELEEVAPTGLFRFAPRAPASPFMRAGAGVPRVEALEGE